jgi:uncharacterized membrane protein (Fun14 family)
MFFPSFKKVSCDVKPDSEKPGPPDSMFEVLARAIEAPGLTRTAHAFKEPETYYGFAAGACTGFALKKIAKAAALTFGAVFLGFQVAARSDYVQVNWDKIERDVKSYMPEQAGNEDRMVPKMVEYLNTNTGIATSVFTAGFLTGLKIG